MDIKYQVIIEKCAQKDIINIYNYIAFILGNIFAADKLVNRIYEKFDEISLFPKSAPVLSNEFVNNSNIRKILIDNYIAFYEIDEASKEIIILRILHCSMNYNEMF